MTTLSRRFPVYFQKTYYIISLNVISYFNGTIGRLQLCHKNHDLTPSWLISKTKMASGLWSKDSSAYYEKCGFDPYQSSIPTKSIKMAPPPPPQWLDVMSCANDL